MISSWKMQINVYPILVLFVVSFILSAKRLFGMQKVPRRYNLALSAILLLFVIYSWFFVPNLNRVFDDEMIILQRSVGYDGNLYLAEDVPQKHMAVKGIYSALFWILGPSNIYAIKLNIILAALSLYLLFYLVLIESDDPVVATIAALLLILQPSYLIQATSSYVMIIAFMFALISCIAFRAYLRYGDGWSAALLGFSAALSILSKDEFLILVPIFIAWEVIHNLRGKGRRTYYVWSLVPIAVFVLDIIPILRYKAWEYSLDVSRSFGIRNLIGHAADLDIGQACDPSCFSLWAIIFVVILFAVSLFYLRKRPDSYMLPSISAILLIIYMMNGLFEDYYAIPVIAFMGVSLGVLIASAFKKVDQAWKTTLVVSFVLLFFLALLFSYGLVRTFESEQPQNFLNTLSPTILERHVPPGCVIVTTRFSYVMMGTDLRSLDTNLVNADPSVLDNERCILFYADYFCQTDRIIPGTVEECRDYLNANVARELLVIRDDKRNLKNTLYVINGSYPWNSEPVVEYI